MIAYKVYSTSWNVEHVQPSALLLSRPVHLQHSYTSKNRKEIKQQIDLIVPHFPKLLSAESAKSAPFSAAPMLLGQSHLAPSAHRNPGPG